MGLITRRAVLAGAGLWLGGRWLPLDLPPGRARKTPTPTPGAGCGATPTTTPTATPTATATTTATPIPTATATATVPATFTPTPTPTVTPTVPGDFFVDADAGDNSLAGTSPATAWRDLSVVGERAGTAGGPGPGSRVLVRGTHRRTLILTHGGTADRPLTIENWEGGRRFALDTGLDLTGGWARHSGDVWRRGFAPPSMLPSRNGAIDSCRMSTFPDSRADSRDRDAFLFVGSGARDAAHWFRPMCDLEYPDPAHLRPGEFWAVGGGPSWVYANFAHLTADPNALPITGCAYSDSILLWGASHVALVGWEARHAIRNVETWSAGGRGVVLADFLCELTKGRNINSQRGEAGHTYRDFVIRDSEYEAIHCEASDTLIERGTIADTIAPWAYWGAGGVNVIGARVTARDVAVSGMRASAVRPELAWLQGGYPAHVETFAGWDEAGRDVLFERVTGTGCDQGIASGGALGWALRACVVRGCGAGIGAFPASGRATELTATDCIVGENRGAGVTCDPGTRVRLVGGYVWGNRPDYYTPGDFAATGVVAGPPAGG
jgi:hypothetical protein